MNSSESLNELAAALAKAQGAMTGAVKDAANPFFKSRYADLESVWTACRKALSDNGLSVVQYSIESEAKGPMLLTRLLHSSGQWIEGAQRIAPKDDSPQAIGSAMTYARRYGLAAMVGVYQSDDDAEAAQGRPAQPRDFSPHPDTSGVPVEVTAKYVAALRDALAKKQDAVVLSHHNDLNNEGQEAYSAVWKVLGSGERSAIKDAIQRARDAKGKF